MVYMRKKRFARRKFSKSRDVSATSAQFGRKAEVKVLDVGTFAVPVTTTAGTISLNTIAAGVQLYERVGRQINMKSIEIKGYFYGTGQAGAPDAIRCAIVYDRTPDGVAPAFADVFASVDNTGAVTVDSFAFPNVGNEDRFKIISEWHLPVIPSVTATNQFALAVQDQNLPLFIHRKIPLRGLVARYAQAATVPQTGGLYLCIRGIVAAGSQPWNVTLTSRLTYTDV